VLLPHTHGCGCRICGGAALNPINVFSPSPSYTCDVEREVRAGQDTVLWWCLLHGVFGRERTAGWLVGGCMQQVAAWAQRGPFVECLARGDCAGLLRGRPLFVGVSSAHNQKWVSCAHLAPV
jgi:hypothetical protein